MVTIYSYDIANAVLARPSIVELPELLEVENVDLWVDLEDPSPEESDILRTVFHFHELAIEDCIQTDIEEPKLDDYEDYLFLVMHSVRFNPEMKNIDIREIDLFFGKNFVLTFHKQSTPGIIQLKKRLEKQVDFMAKGSDEIFHAIVDNMVDNYIVSFKQLERMIFTIETELLSVPTKETFNGLFKLKISLIHLRRTLNPAEEVMETLATTEHELIQEENKVYFQDVHDHISKIEGLQQSYMEMVSTAMDNYVSLSSHRMNIVMQTLTVLATFILIPTLISSIYGMNIPLPGQNSHDGFIYFIVLTVVITALMFWYFKKKDWL